jgi:hypothetical protein
MHSRFLVTFDKDRAAASQEARQYAFNTLHDEGFCGEGRWSAGLADWFVIGGRWSGELSRASWAREITAEMKGREQEHGVWVWGVFYGDPNKERVQTKLAAEFQGLWDRTAPAVFKDIPMQRDTYAEYGYEDDAMLLTQDLYDALLKEYEGQEDSEYHADLDVEAVAPDMVGRKWLVVVDYHS